MRISFFKLIPAILAVLIQSALFAQTNFSISGSVTDANNQVLSGATVKIKDTYSGAISNSTGNFTIQNVPMGTVVLEISFLGFNPLQKSVDVKNNITELTLVLQESSVMAKDFVVLANYVSEKTPMTVQTLDSAYLAANNIGVDLPIILEQATSVVSTSDAGNGIGYSSMRIRGSDATRVNITINGIPYNDPESQGSYFVNLPDFTSSANDIQIQRGVGTSTNGAGAFGGSVNINTTELTPEAYGKYTLGLGSFNTLRNSLSFGTGLTKNGFAFDGRLSQISSDGYIDRANSDLKSYYAKAGYYGKKFSAKFITFGGNERTYQAWYGVPQDSLKNHRTYNPYDYKDQVDNYSQTHYQMHLNYSVNDHWKAAVSGFTILGKGYYEEYKGDQYNAATGAGPQNLADYGLAPVIVGMDTIYETNLIRRRWLDNTFTGGIFNLNYTGSKLDLIIGGGYNEYSGSHFGEIIWAEYASNGQKDHRYYDNIGYKTDMNLYVKANYQLNDKLNIYGDLQGRNVTYTVSGMDNDQRELLVDDQLSFFNPKAGLSYEFNNMSRSYLSFAVANHEPSRGDYIDAPVGTSPKHESLMDFEGGYKYANNKLMASANVYYMLYKDQLVVTGAVNDVGSAIRQNVDESYRMGLELELGYKITKSLSWSFNTTLSESKINSFTQYVDDWYNGGQVTYDYTHTDIAFSPRVILGNIFSYKRELTSKSDLGFALISKYVGKQYFDNTQNEGRSLEAYFTNDVRLSYGISNFGMNKLNFNFTVRNILNTLYVNNAWTYTFEYNDAGWDPSEGDPYTQKSDTPGAYQMTGYFPQAGVNYMFGLTMDF